MSERKGGGGGGGVIPCKRRGNQQWESGARNLGAESRVSEAERRVRQGV